MAALLLCSLTATAQNAAPLTVAASTDLELVMRELQPEFEQQTGARLNVVYGASGSLTAQIESGAPIDVFLSADMGYPRKLISQHLTTGKTAYRYAIGRLVLWTPESTGLELTQLGLDSLLSSKVSKIAMANPRHAPYGQAALAALRGGKLYGKVSSKLVMADTVSQAKQLVDSGGAQVGLLPLSLVFTLGGKGKGVYYELPSDAYPVMEQGAVVLARTGNRQLADEFLAFLKRPQTILLFKKYGYQEPPTLNP